VVDHAIEACTDAAQHCLLVRGLGSARDNGDAMLVLGHHNVLESDLAHRSLAAAVVPHVKMPAKVDHCGVISGSGKLLRSQGH
jgi:hypothetical protein